MILQKLAAAFTLVGLGLIACEWSMVYNGQEFPLPHFLSVALVLIGGFFFVLCPFHSGNPAEVY